MKRAYRMLLRLYPAPYFRMYGSEMAGVFDDAWSHCDARGYVRRAIFLQREFAGVLVAAAGMRSAGYVRRPRPFGRFFVLGAAVAAFGQSILFSNCGIGRHLSSRAEMAETQQPAVDLAMLLLLIGVFLILIFVLCATFVWNMRQIARRRI
jgi:hypothetical protein